MPHFCRRITVQTRRRLLICAALFLAILALPAYPQNSQAEAINAAIDAVQIYSDQAVVTRRARLRLKSGPNLLRIAELTPQLDDSTVRVAFDRSDLRIQEVAVRSSFRERYLSSEAEKAELALKDAESELRKLTDRYTALKKEEQQLAALEVARIPENPEEAALRAPIDAGRWMRTLDFVQNALSENQQQVSQLLTEIDLARERLLVAIAVADRYRDARNLQSKEVSIAVECAPTQCDATQPLELELRYTVSGVAWFPIYTARVDSSGGQTKLRLTSYALLKNQSGEDWPEASFTFSAADPRESADLAILPEWRIQQRIVAAESIEDVASEREEARGSGRRTQPGGGAPASTTAPMRPQPAAEAQAFEPSGGAVSDDEGPAPQQQIQAGLFGRLQEQRNRSNAYFNENRAAVREEQANSRNVAAGQALQSIQNALRARDQAVERNDFNGALQFSEQIIEQVRSLDARYQPLFSEEMRRSLQTRRMALDMIELQGMMRMLQPPQTSARGFDVAFRASGRDNAPSEPGFTRILLDDRELPIALSYESAPERRELAFLVGKAANSGGSPLLAGPAAVFHNRDYVGEAAIDTVGPRAEFPVHLGAIDDLRIQRRVTDRRDEGGIISTERILRREVQLKIHNQKRSAVSLDLFERLPIASDERIRISAPTISEPVTERRDQYGLLRFRLNLAPGEQKTITIRYEIRHPDDILPRENEGGGPQW